MIRVFIADDHAIVRTGLSHLLATAPDMQTVGAVGDGRAVLTAAEAPDWPVDVVILDLSLPIISGIEVLRRLHESRPTLPVLVLSMHAESQYAQRLISLGAAGYVSKDRSDTELLTAIRTVSQGRLYVTRSYANGARAAELPHEKLSARQLQVFSLLVAGRTVSEIACELDLTVSTVSTHLGHVKTKLGVRTAADIIHYAHRMQLA